MLVAVLIAFRFTLFKDGLVAYLAYVLFATDKKLTRLKFRDFINPIMHEVVTWKYTWVCYLVEPYVVSIILRAYNVGYLS